MTTVQPIRNGNILTYSRLGILEDLEVVIDLDARTLTINEYNVSPVEGMVMNEVLLSSHYRALCKYQYAGIETVPMGIEQISSCFSFAFYESELATGILV